jgi:fucose 4-O-acetylase-like acetyltransferase
VLGFYLIFVAFNIWYGIEGHKFKPDHPVEQVDAGGPEERNIRWDVTKFVCMVFVIFYHLSQNVFWFEDLTPGLTMLIDLVRGWVMPCFVFISGVVASTRFDTRSVIKTFCFPWLNFCLICVMAVVGHFWAHKGPLHLWNGFGFWYLWCVFFWRLTVTPIVHFVRIVVGHRMCPRADPVLAVAVWAAVFVASYLLLHLTADWGSLLPNELWRCYIFHAPLFAAGQFFTPSTWNNLMAHQASTASAIVFFILWHGLLMFCESFKTWNLAACADAGTRVHTWSTHSSAAAADCGLLARPRSLAGAVSGMSTHISRV